MGWTSILVHLPEKLQIADFLRHDTPLLLALGGGCEDVVDEQAPAFPQSLGSVLFVPLQARRIFLAIRCSPDGQFLVE